MPDNAKAPAQALIDVENLSKAFGLRFALRGVTFQIPRGQVVALLGPNGSGKTTLLRTLSALSSPTSGRITIGGWSLPREAGAVRGQLGVVGHLPLLYDDLSAAENLHVFATLYNLPAEIGKAALAERIKTGLARVGLAKRAEDRARTFSRGMLQRLALARAMLHDPAVLLLDEPYTGLDAPGIALLDGLIAEWRAAGKTVIAALHDIPRAAQTCERALILSGGRLAADVQTAEVPDLLALFTQLAVPQ